MASLATSFSIHQDLWHDCWVAATSAVRSKKKQVDFNIQQRVARLLQDHGPQTDLPLTLRVYGTMIKGFCVLNNERARALHGDCERLVLAFTQQPFGDEGKTLRLPNGKRKQADALTLDLDVSKVQESEAFDWTQAPLEEGTLLQLLPPPEGAATPAQAAPPPPLLLQADLLDESFPAIDVPMTEPHDMTTVPPAAAVAEDLAAQPTLADVDMQVVPEYPLAALPALADADAGELMPQEELDGALASFSWPAAPSRAARKVLLPMQPGRVFGFDEESVMPAEAWEAWKRDDREITIAARGPEAQAAMMPPQPVDRLGSLLRSLLEPSGGLDRPAAPGDAAAVAALFEGLAGGREGQQDPHDAMPLQIVTNITPSAAPPGAAGVGHAACETTADPFRPYTPEPPLASTAGADVELAGVLSKPASQSGLGEQPKAGGGKRGKTPKYDEQTAQVGEVLRRYLAAGAHERQGGSVTLDDLLPPGRTDKATAAKMFHALLTLATAGEMTVLQQAPYAALAISMV